MCATIKRFFSRILLLLVVIGFAVPASAQLSCPPNIDFEEGTTNHWNTYIGSCCPITTPTMTSTPVTGRHTVTSAASVDPYGLFPVVAPGSGLHSLKLGNSSTGAQAEKVRYSVHVPSGSSNYALFYRYAVVLQDPSHTTAQQPRFEVNTYDSATGSPIPCAEYTYTSSSSMPGFVLSSHISSTPTTPIYFKPWTDASLNLTGLAGHTVIVDFASGDCSLGGHFGYGYLDMQCSLFAIDVAPCDSVTPIALSAPAGFMSYSWVDSATMAYSYGTTQTVTVPFPTTLTTYAVILTPYTGYGCPDTLFTHVDPSTLTYLPPPNAGTITGDSIVCEASTISVVDTATGGVWSCASANATVWAGVVTGVSAGTATISYSVTNSCGTDVATHVVTINPLPVPGTITGTTTICAGDSSLLADASPGGVWSSGGAAATVSSTGMTTGVSAGTAAISYSVTNSCGTDQAIAIMTINGVPGAISGNVATCAAGTFTLTNTVPGGTWSCSPSTIATISTAGVVTGVAPGTAIVTYTTPCGAPTTVVTVNPSPGPITGNIPLCPGDTNTLHNTLSGGIWTSSAPAVATINAAGRVTAVAPGTTIVSYTTGCLTQLKVVTVNAIPGVIAGNLPVCPGSTRALSNSATGGTWSCSPSSIATISSTGVLTGVSGGTASVTYTAACGTVYAVVTVNDLPGSISGNVPVCPAASITLTNSLAGGAWTISPTSVATITSGGVVSGVAPGTATVSYTTTCSSVTAVVTVSPMPGAITGNVPFCPATTIALGNSVTGGTWSCTPATIATVDASGNVSGVASGTAVVSYTTGCAAVGTVVTVLALPGAIAGNTPLCPATTITLSNSLVGGTWSCSPATVATISSGGVVTAIAAGTATVSYMTTCASVSTVVTVNAPAGAITGNAPACPGASIVLSNSVGGGTWSCSPLSVASVDASGNVTCISTGTATVSYTTACGASGVVVTVLPTPGAIAGNVPVCPAASIALSNSLASGAWSVGPAGVATISAGGTLSGVAPGTTIVTYATGCGSVSATATVTALPGAIAGLSPVCPGASVLLTNSLGGGTWSCSPTSVATIDASGNLSGVAAGTVNVTYTTTCGTATGVGTVLPLPGAITGNAPICPGTTAALGNALAGGTWISGSPGIATVNTVGVVTAVAPGTAIISYTTTCQTITTIFTVNPVAGAITGVTPVCPGNSVMLSNSLTGGTWTCSPGTVATISAAGLLTGVAAGTATVSYTTACGSVSAIVSVHALPGSISGVAPVCPGKSLTLGNSLAGGTWSSTPTSRATISPAGTVSGVAPGTAIISYATTCASVGAVVTVTGLPSAIAGNAPMCPGNTNTLTDTLAGGTWSSSNAAVATIGAGGIVSAISAGTSIITYTTTCAAASVVVTVNALAGPITGNAPLCPGNTMTLANSLGGGAWTCSPSSVATISAAGVVTAVGAGTATISYNTACSALAVTVTVNGLPGPITGNVPVCPASTITLGNTLSGGTWTCTPATIASVSPTGGLSGITTGTAVVSYLTTCANVGAVVTVHPLPGPIAGSMPTCPGATYAVANSLAGGTWSCNPSSVATISSSGVVTSVGAGLAVITYTHICTAANTLVTVHALAGPITGNAPICPVYSLPLGNSVPGGTWTCTPSSVATISPAGILVSIAPGTAIVSYTSICNAVSTIATVSATPLPVTGSVPVCMGGTVSLSCALPGGTWTCSPSSVATVSSTGLVSSLSAGTAAVVYSTSCGPSMAIVTINPLPGAITGNVPICAGSTMTLGNAVPGGTWSAAATSVALVAPTGVVTGMSAGTVMVTYTTTCGAVYAMVTVNGLPSLISGNAPVCIGNTIVLGNAAPGGTWTCAPSSIATISSAGVLSGVGIGTATVSYVTGCGATFAIATVTPLVSAVMGNVPVCLGNSITLTNAAPGFWISADPTVASITSVTGILTAVSAGTALISFSSPCGIVTTIATVNPLPGPNTGSTPMCVGNSCTLSNAMAGGTWVSLNPSVATVDSVTGIVTGVGAGTAFVSYTVSTCSSPVTVVTVMTTPAPIAGNVPVCSGSGISLTNATAGGTWSCSPTIVATITSAGTVSGVAGGTASVTYAIGACRTWTVVTVNQSPTISGIVPVKPVCTGSPGSLTLLGLLPGAPYALHYTFSSSVTVADTTDATGSIVIPGLVPGAYTSISVTDAQGCTSNVMSIMLTAIGMPAAAIAAANEPCQGDTLQLSASSPTTGVTWRWDGPSGFTATTAHAQISPAMPSNSGVYSVGVTIGICTVTTTVAAIVHESPTPAATNVLNPSGCKIADGALLFSGMVAGAVYDIGYSFGGTVTSVSGTADAGGVVSLSGLAPGTYTNVVIRSAYGCVCQVLGPFVLAYPGAPPPPVPVATTPCEGQTLELKATDAVGAGEFNWLYPDGGSAAGATVLRENAETSASGIYTVTYTLLDCEAKASLPVTVVARPHLVNVTGSQTIGLGASIRLYAEGADSWHWAPDSWLDDAHSATPLSTPRETVTYTVTGTNGEGCYDTASVTITVEDMDVYVPTAFTPDGDGRNDVFRIRGISAKRFVQLAIYNRPGQRIYFNDSDPDAGWDGTEKGRPCDIGTYFYFLVVREADGTQRVLKGDITLIR
ncbi:MAG: gliding motility-associated C-terminal domain-containing protein [Taibaiella sp.]|nr:gliding motility-associated C-terminal domain-containing protein [Taibaiella sp.]